VNAFFAPGDIRKGEPSDAEGSLAELQCFDARNSEDGLFRLGANARKLALAAAGVQALSLVARVLICWVLVPEAEADFFAAVYLAGATMNAVLSRPHFSHACDMRFLLFGLAALAALLLGFGENGAYDFTDCGHLFLAAIDLFGCGQRHRHRREPAGPDL